MIALTNKSSIHHQLQDTSADFYCIRRFCNHLSLFFFLLFVSSPCFFFFLLCPPSRFLCLSFLPPSFLCVPVGFLQQQSCSSVSMRGRWSMGFYTRAINQKKFRIERNTVEPLEVMKRLKQRRVKIGTEDIDRGIVKRRENSKTKSKK